MSEAYLDKRPVRLSDGEVDATIIDIDAVPENTFFQVGAVFATPAGIRALLPRSRETKCDCKDGPVPSCVRAYNKDNVLEIIRENICFVCGGAAR